MEVLLDQHLRSDYLVVSNRLTDLVEPTEGSFDTIRDYYTALLGGVAGYELVKSFRSRPGLWGVTIDDSSAEHTFRIFDHPDISIYKRSKQ